MSVGEGRWRGGQYGEEKAPERWDSSGGREFLLKEIEKQGSRNDDHQAL